MGARDQLSKCQRERQYQPWKNISNLVGMLMMKAQFQFLLMYHALYCTCLLEQALLSTRMICCQHMCIVIMRYTNLPQWLTKLCCPTSWCLWDYKHSWCYQTSKENIQKNAKILRLQLFLGLKCNKAKMGKSTKGSALYGV